MRLLFIIIPLLWVGCASTQAVSDEDAALLREAEVVKSARVGFAGELAAETQAFRHLLAASNASQRFEQVLEQSTQAGQMYALAGLYLTDRARFDEVVTRYEDDQREVEVFVGDVVGMATVAAIVGYVPSNRTPGSILDGTWPRALAGESERP